MLDTNVEKQDKTKYNNTINRVTRKKIIWNNTLHQNEMYWFRI